MRIRFAVAFALIGSLVGCSSILDQEPTGQGPAEDAIINAQGARAALAGAYAGLQSDSYYGGDFVFFGDLPSDNADHTGTFTSYGQADDNQFRADNATAYDIWAAIYDPINRVNNILLKVPALTDLDETEKNEILGEAFFLRALHYHNLVKLYGDVPIRLVPVNNLDEAADAVRAPVAEVYTQILSDLDQAGTLITDPDPTDADTTTRATVVAVSALRARVQLYRGDYAAALTNADAVIAAGRALAPAFSDLFDAEGQDTDEDIFKVLFNAQQFSLEGFYYTAADFDGRGELAPSQNLIDAFEPDDARLAWSIFVGDDVISGSKWATTIGAEDMHVIRFAEVLLIRAEALARQNDLVGAVDTYNQLRARAGLAAHTLGAEVTTQADVLAAIELERRRELAFEGDRWPDLVRTGRAVEVLGIPEFQTLFPIPQAEIDVAPGLTQNPGY
ncbi:MAG TPA: RagB/SusD family nutrient uptake outer membrane protein [Gemmatimonadales bacterium]|jgi:hypothetical protein